MNVIQFSLQKPVAVTVLVIFLLIFGVLSLQHLPKQLTPNVIEAEISVETIWPGASPFEIEQEIISKQELVLKNTPGITSYESKSLDNTGTVTLKFSIGTDINKALLDVSNKLTEVESYPENTLKPVIKATGASTSPVIWTMLRTLPKNPNNIDQYKTYLDNEIREYYERIPGVAELFLMSGTPQQVQIILDFKALAKYNLSLNQVITAIKKHHHNISAGSIDIGRRSYRIRMTAKFSTPASVGEKVISTHNNQPIKLKNIAIIAFGYENPTAISMVDGVKGLVIGVKPENNANLISLTNQVEKMVNELNQGKLKTAGLKIQWLHDNRAYIQGSIDLVQQNILIGGSLAIMILLLFLRSISATTVIALAIPISIISTFLILDMMHRTLNTISLAGISFSVGMLVDSAIVVLENIDRHKKMGKAFMNAAFDGTSEVWGALIASGLTTVAVFLPVVFLENEAGQLFKDIAIAVTVAVTFSLFVSISVIPMLWRQLMHFHPYHSHQPTEKKSILVTMGNAFSNSIMYILHFFLKSAIRRGLLIIFLIGGSIVSIVELLPKMEYLPQGNRNLIFNILIPPPGLSYREKKQIGETIFKKIKPHMGNAIGKYPAIARAFYVAGGDFMIFGVISADDRRVSVFKSLLQPIANSFPGIFGITIQAGVFDDDLGKGRNIDVDISGKNIEKLADIGSSLFGTISSQIPESQIRPVPSIELLFPEIRLIPNDLMLSKLDMDAFSLGVLADVLMQGRKIGEFQIDGTNKINIILKADEHQYSTAEDMMMTQVVTPNGQLVNFNDLAKFKRTSGISEIRHVQGKRTITLEVTPPEHYTIQEGIELLSNKIIPELKKQGKLKDVNITLSGTSDKLIETMESMQVNLILAVIITYLIMAALFSNFIYPFIILFTLPLAAAGGIIGLHLTSHFLTYQPLDVLTMLGFVILVGIVVNNAILIVHQTLNLIRYHNIQPQQAIYDATQSRLRPIFMSTLTSTFGMLPLILMPGPGSEFYRGLGSVITGGLVFSTVFTIFVIPALLMSVIRLETPNERKNY